MSEQSGCDPQAAVRARMQKSIDDNLKAVLVEGAHVTFSPISGEVSIEMVITESHVEPDGTLVIDAAAPIETFLAPTIRPVDMSDEDYERLHDLWIKVDPRIQIVITEPMERIVFGRDPGDETAA